MRVDRRTFLRLASGAGLGIAGLSRGTGGRAFASDGPWPGPFWVTVHAGGGWDPTLLCDPKGFTNPDATDNVNTYPRDEIVPVGPFSCAPIEGVPDFFERWGSELLAINGIDTGTNSHDTGVRHVWSGSFELDAPSVAALLAAATPQAPPGMAFLSYGGYDATGRIVPATRLPSGDTVREIARPHFIDANNPDSSPFTEAGWDAIREARLQRLERRAQAATLAHEQRAQSMLFEAWTQPNRLEALHMRLPEDLDSSSNPLLRQAQLACASFRAGMSVSANLVIGGFDTHGNHDQDHIPRLRLLLDGVSFLLEEAERQGVRDKMVVMIGSDFARTPFYNQRRGKDHWPITSMLMLGPGIRGGRVIGGTDDGQGARTINPSTLALDPGGVRITPGHIHASLRQLAGIADDPDVVPFRLHAPALPLFT